MRYLFVLVFLLVSISSYLFAYDYSVLYQDCGRRKGFEILNCKKGEACLNKKVLYDTDIRCAIKNVYKVSLDDIYVHEKVDLNEINNNSIVEQYIEGFINMIKVSYYEHVGNELKEKRVFYCGIPDEIRGEFYVCAVFSYEIDGKEVEFNESLKGKDPVYDWVMKNMPKNRPNAKYIDFGPDIDSSQFTVY